MLVWMDLEMTGLDPQRHAIVEIATLITDNDLNIVAEGPDLVLHATDDQLSHMEPIVKDMHTKSGLLEEINKSVIGIDEAEEQTLKFIKEHIPKASSAPLCGNSIGTDRRFLSVQMPDIENYLHYRSVDVSTIKELCRRWYPDDFANAPGKKAGHRALDDIRESINELRYYREAIFKKA